jgi:adenylate kinase family enzyme
MRTRPAGFILDGYPRSVEQAKALDEMLKNHDTKLDAVLEFAVSEEELLERLKRAAAPTTPKRSSTTGCRCNRERDRAAVGVLQPQQPAEGQRRGRAG